MKRKTILLLSLLIAGALTLPAESPEWIGKLPFSDDAFWGVGQGETVEVAEAKAIRDIMMQLSSQVKAAITMEERSGGGEFEVKEKLDSYFGSGTLHGAELVETYSDDSTTWVLMKYCDECGDMLINSALVRFEETFEYESEEVLERIDSSNIKEALKMERRLWELDLEDYNSDDIMVSMSDREMILRIINFLPEEPTLSESQNRALQLLSQTLLKELLELNVREIHVIGHANPTGEENEEEELISLSRNRAQTLADVLTQAGIDIDSVNWKGGDEVIGDSTTKLGAGRNRRVEIRVFFEEGVK